jgi:cytochrome P450
MTQIPWLDWLLHKNRLINWIKPEAMSTLFAYVLARVAERRNSPKTLNKADADGPDATGDFLDYFLQAEEKKSGKVSPRFLPMWTLANILGGSDSAAAVLRSVICSLVEHPEDLESVREELRNKQRSITGLSLPVPKWREIQDLPFLDACVKESLRLEPPFAMALERVIPSEGASICGRFFPAGTIVGMSPYATHRYRPTWGEDADLWRPRRWLEGDPERIRKLEASLLTVSQSQPISLRH